MSIEIDLSPFDVDLGVFVAQVGEGEEGEVVSVDSMLLSLFSSIVGQICREMCQ